MSLEAIKTVAAAETDAEKQRTEALAEAKRIVTAAEAAGKEDVQKAMETASSQAQSLCQEAEKLGRDTASKAAVEAREKCDALAKDAMTRMDRAVAIIVEKVVNAQ